MVKVGEHQRRGAIHVRTVAREEVADRPELAAAGGPDCSTLLGFELGVRAT